MFQNADQSFFRGENNGRAVRASNFSRTGLEIGILEWNQCEREGPGNQEGTDKRDKRKF